MLMSLSSGVLIGGLGIEFLELLSSIKIFDVFIPSEKIFVFTS